MKKRNLLILTITVIAATACGGKGELEQALNDIKFEPAPSRPEPTAVGKNDGLPFVIRSAAISKDPYIMGMYQLILSNEARSACYGLGNNYVKVPVSQTNVVGRHELQKSNRIWSAFFIDGSREARVEEGYTFVRTFGAATGTAKVKIGMTTSLDFIDAEVEFENCIR